MLGNEVRSEAAVGRNLLCVLTGAGNGVAVTLGLCSVTSSTNGSHSPPFLLFLTSFPTEKLRGIMGDKIRLQSSRSRQCASGYVVLGAPRYGHPRQRLHCRCALSGSRKPRARCGERVSVYVEIRQ